MADAAPLPNSILIALSDQSYDTRRVAALEVEKLVRELIAVGDIDRIAAVITVLTNDLAHSSNVNSRKGGLIGLAAAAIGMESEAIQYLDRIAPPVLSLLTDLDSRVRYYGCEAIYNIAKVCQGDFLIYTKDIFDALSRLSADSDQCVRNAAQLVDAFVQAIVSATNQLVLAHTG